MPVLLMAIVAGGLVLADIVPLSTMLYAGMFGAMLLMHRGGHSGHGSKGHDGTGGHANHAGQAGDEPADATPDGEADKGRGSQGCH
jgi:hypothetical protein